MRRAFDALGSWHDSEVDGVESRTSLFELCDGRLELVHWDRRTPAQSLALTKAVRAGV